MSASRGAVRLRDVALDAGVSVSTASRALANAGAISGEVRRRVRDAAQRLGYPARGSAGPGLRSVRLVVTLDTFSHDAAGFYTDIIAGACDALARLGLASDVAGFAAGPGLAAALAARQAEAAAEGLLLLAIDDEAVLAACAVPGAPPTVLLNGADPQMRLDGVAPNNARGAALATRHLIELGHRRIAYAGSRRRATIAERFDGFVAALAAAGLRPDPADCLDLPNLLPDLAHAAMGQRLDRDAGARAGTPFTAPSFTAPSFTAVVCGNDLVALGVARALHDRGLRVPADVSVIGFDDVPTAALADPPLTTIAVDRRGLGAAGVRLLTERAANPGATPVTQQLGCQLVRRASTAAPPAPTPPAPRGERRR